MNAFNGAFGVTSIVVLAALGLQAWTVLRTARRLDDRLSLTLFVAGRTVLRPTS